MRRFVIVLAIGCLFFVNSRVNAGSIYTVDNSGGVYGITDSGAGFAAAYPFNATPTNPAVATVTTGNESAMTTFTPASNSFTLGFMGSRDGANFDYAESMYTVYFTPTVNETYNLLGSFTVNEPELSFVVTMSAGSQTLYSGSVTEGNNVYHGMQTVTLGTSSYPATAGAVTGTLMSGTTYELTGDTFIAPNPNHDSGAMGSGSLTLSLTPAVTTPLPSPAAGAALILGGMLIFRNRRAGCRAK